MFAKHIRIDFNYHTPFYREFIAAKVKITNKRQECFTACNNF